MPAGKSGIIGPRFMEIFVVHFVCIAKLRLCQCFNTILIASKNIWKIYIIYSSVNRFFGDGGGGAQIFWKCLQLMVFFSSNGVFFSLPPYIFFIFQTRAFCCKNNNMFIEHNTSYESLFPSQSFTFLHTPSPSCSRI